MRFRARPTRWGRLHRSSVVSPVRTYGTEIVDWLPALTLRAIRNRTSLACIGVRQVSVNPPFGGGARQHPPVSCRAFLCGRYTEARTSANPPMGFTARPPPPGAFCKACGRSTRRWRPAGLAPPAQSRVKQRRNVGARLSSDFTGLRPCRVGWSVQRPPGHRDWPRDALCSALVIM